MIAVLGMGLLGANFSRALLERGETVHVWNRSPERAQALVEEGAVAFADAAEAVAGAERVHIVVSDDAAVDSVLALAQCAPGTLVIDHTTTSTRGALARTARTDIVYVHAPVFMGPSNARDATGLMLVSGDRERVDRVRPLLETMTGTLLDMGERVDAAAGFKLMGNTFLLGHIGAMSDLMALGKALGIPTEEAVTLLEHFNPAASAPARSKGIAAGDFSKPSWELVMARKDARLVAEEVAATDVRLTVLPGVAERMDEMIARGHGQDDWAVIAKDSLLP
ncbi:MAG: NAD-binding protein [Actinobacteria bacterium]|uniref:Unannotated protein n=1 Tax=freshwater metagenome TaxID=449393 RepID=A0A6J6P8N0_9ZZZZ|nr:NAD-binding protein [Actinomycetota bacterium]